MSIKKMKFNQPVEVKDWFYEWQTVIPKQINNKWTKVKCELIDVDGKTREIRIDEYDFVPKQTIDDVIKEL